MRQNLILFTDRLDWLFCPIIQCDFTPTGKTRRELIGVVTGVFDHRKVLVPLEESTLGIPSCSHSNQHLNLASSSV
jgi:hypothetical protein